MKKYLILVLTLITATLLLVYCADDTTSSSQENLVIPEDTTATTSETSPNILLIIADDMGLDATPGYSVGSLKPNMPNLTKLAENGITFDRVWAYPTCSPTRSSIISGRTGFQTDVLNAESHGTLRSSEKTIQRYLDENTNKKYAHAIIGKWHLSPTSETNRATEMGIDYYAGLLGGGVSNYFDWSFTNNGVTENSTEYITTKITNLTIDWIGKQTKPWFAWVAYTAPHTPFHAPPDSMHSQGTLPNDQASIDSNPSKYFMAMIESVDHEIGRLLNSLSQAEKDNTVIIFIGDNGTHAKVVQEHKALHSKGSIYQGGVNVPMIISGKGVTRKNQRDSSLIQISDFFASIAEIAGIKLSKYEDSYSFYPLLTTSGVGEREYVYSEILNEDNDSRSGHTIRNYRYKYLKFDSETEEMYDLSTDPYEERNILKNPMFDKQSEKQQLIDKLQEIRTKR